MDRFSFLNTVSPEYIEEIYKKYLTSPDSVETSWRLFFQGYDFAKEEYSQEIDVTDEKLKKQVPDEVLTEFKVVNLINAYRTRGHLFTKTNPVRERRNYYPTLDIENFGLNDSDLDKTFQAGEILGIGGPTTLRNIIEHLKNIYCDSIGIEYMYIRNPEVVEWIQKWINDNMNQPSLTVDEKKQTLSQLNKAVTFENFLHTKFVGQKRFSLEGGESLIPAIEEIIDFSGDRGVEEVVIGMAHRGRLNTLVNVMGKPYAQVFSELEGKEFEDDIYSGDVKYHLGSTTYTKNKKGKNLILNLAPNPSHLEAVDGVVEGISRAKVDLNYNSDYSKILPIIIHGDAAIAGQGIMYELVPMAGLKGYKTGGTIHLVVNNQIGFTTNYIDGRTSVYCTDVAKVTLSPVLHVNDDDVEAVIHSVRFAVDFRAKFGRDVFIDLLGYRKYGHNEGDEPRFTQPNLYKAIQRHPNPRDIYAKKLEEEGVVTKTEVKKMETDFKEVLEKSYDESKTLKKVRLDPFMPADWKGYRIVDEKTMLEPVNTTFPKQKLYDIGVTISTLPEHKKFLNKTTKLMNQRRDMLDNGKIDWGMAEMLAYGSLLEQGYNVRISGEDVERGTFSHRHALVKSEDAEEDFVMLNKLSPTQGRFTIYNSLLSEYGVLGFEFGYGMSSPKSLTVWEAQFGDFANGAQIIIDQYIAAAEDKWKVQNGMALYLPHGYEGQGAEHSSARVERFLQLAADANMFVVNCTTPTNAFHVLRRQLVTDYRKPLIFFTPKSLLRHPRAVASIDELATGQFTDIIDDTTQTPEKVKKVVFMSGKIYYDLLAKQEELKDDSVALVRMEQLYPINREKINEILKRYPNREELIWVQEEPENMGPWSYILMYLRDLNFTLIASPPAASPAPGSHKSAEIQHNKTINRVFQ